MGCARATTMPPPSTFTIFLKRHAALQTRILAERADSKREGEVLRQQARQEVEESKARELARLAKAQQLNYETKEANRTLQGFKQKVITAWSDGPLAYPASDCPDREHRRIPLAAMARYTQHTLLTTCMHVMYGCAGAGAAAETGRGH
jgi:hypothetical protein